MSHDPLNYPWWLAARTAGIVALLAVCAATATGLYLATKGEPRRPGAARLGRDLHQHLAVVALLATGVHAVTLLGDPWLRPGVSGILLPGAIGYRPLWVGAGIVGGYLMLLASGAYLVRRRIGPSRFKLVHRANLAAFVLVAGHVLGAGTDAATPWLRLVLAAAVAPALFNLVLRLTNPSRRPVAGR